VNEQKRARLFVSLAALSLIVLAGCGGGGSNAAASPAGTATDSASSGVPAEMEPYAACLKQHGVDLPAGGRFQGGGAGGQAGAGGQGGQGGAPPGSFQLGQSQTSTASSTGSSEASPPPSIDRSKFEAARQACADLLPEGAAAFGGPGFGPGGGATGGGANASAFNAYRSCMSDHGVTIPEGQGNQPAQPPASIDRNTDSFKAANDVCSSLLPNGGQGFVTPGTNP
jgi:hypothetical protein